MQIRNWNGGKILAAAGVAGVLVAVGVALAMPGSYTSQSVVKIESPDGGISQDTRDGINDIANSVESRSTLTRVISVLGLYKAERSRMPIEDVIENMKRNIQILPVTPIGSSATPAFAVQFEYSDAKVAQRVTEDLTNRFIEMNLQKSSSSRAMALEVLDPASLPDRASRPNIPVLAFLGLVGGLLLGAILAFRTWKILAAAGLAGALIATGIAWFLPKQYESALVMRFEGSSQQEAIDRINALVNVVEGRESLTQVINLLGLYPRERSKMPLEDVLTRMRQSIAILPVNGVAFAIRFSDSDPRVAQRVTQELASKFIDLNFKQAASSSLTDAMRLEVLDPASLPMQPVFPNTRNIAGVGFGGGLFLGAIFAIRGRKRDQVA